MIFDRKYPGTTAGHQHGNMKKGPADNTLFCFVCRAKTSWIEINFMVPCCSEECNDLLNSRYDAALRQRREPVLVFEFLRILDKRFDMWDGFLAVGNGHWKKIVK